MTEIEHWAILRTAPSRTLALAAALVEAGIVAWTPTVSTSRRVGRKRELVRQDVSLTPSLVFADYAAMPELQRLAHAPALNYQVWDREQRKMVAKGHPPFRVFRLGDRLPWIADRELDALRRAERRGEAPTKFKPLEKGAHVSHEGSGFDGLTGEVVRMKGRYAVVAWPGFTIPVEIEPRYLIAC